MYSILRTLKNLLNKNLHPKYFKICLSLHTIGNGITDDILK